MQIILLFSGIVNESYIILIKGDKMSVRAVSQTIALPSGGIPVSRYITKISSSGIFISSENQTPTEANPANSIKLDGTGMYVYQGGINSAFFGNTVRLGKSSDTHISISSGGFSFNKNTDIIGTIEQLTNYHPGARTYNNAMRLSATEYFEFLVAGGADSIGYSPQLQIEKDSITLLTGNTGVYIGESDYNGDNVNDTVGLHVHLVHPSFYNTAKTMINVSAHDYGIWLGIDENGIIGVHGIDNWIISKRTNNHIYMPNIYNYTGSNAPNVVVYGTGETVRSTSSSERYKKDIEDIEGAEALYGIKVRQFKYRDDYLSSTDKRYNKILPGFIVEELEKVYPIAVDYNDEEQPEDWNFRYLIPGMLKLIQNQHIEIEELKRRIQILEGGE